MRSLIAHLALLSALGLSACASGPDTITQRLAATPPGKYAYVIGTYVVTCEPRNERCDQAFNEVAVSFRSAADKTADRSIKSISGAMFGKDTTHDFVDQSRKEKGFHFASRCPQETTGSSRLTSITTPGAVAGIGSAKRMCSTYRFHLPRAASPMLGGSRSLPPPEPICSA